jgi:hypothetical protein
MAGPAYFSGTMNLAKNEDWVVPFRYNTIDFNGNEMPIDLTGSRLLMELRLRETDHEAVVSVDTTTPPGGIVVTTPGMGEFQIQILRQNMVRLAAGEYFADLVRVMPNGWVERIWEGSAVVTVGTSR